MCPGCGGKSPESTGQVDALGLFSLVKAKTQRVYSQVVNTPRLCMK
jgi:hypothetical protein